jgi:RNA polymerase sigma-70 factor (ECF subfamily)
MTETVVLDMEQDYLLNDDEKLVTAAQRNPVEFRQLYLKWFKRIYRYFYFRVANEKDAEDLTSQVFLRVYEDLPRYCSRGCFSAWLFRIAHARVVDFYRSQSRAVALDGVEQPEVSADLLTQSVQQDDVRQVLRIIQQLSAEEQELIRLRFMAELSYREIGQVLDRKEDAVRKSLSRLLERMQSQMEVHHD